MTTLPQTPIRTTSINRGWLWAVRIAALLGPSILWMGMLPGLPFGACAELKTFPILDVAGAIVFTLLSLMILLHLRGHGFKLGLAMAVTTAALGILMLGLVFGETRYAIWIMASQAALLTTAIIPYYLMGRETGDAQTLVRGLIATVIYLAFFLLGVGFALSMWFHFWSVNQASPVGSLRTINTSEVTYSDTYRQGFSPTLAALGPGPNNALATPSGAELIDNVLASGRKGAYTFTYVAGPRDANGKIETYTVVARPNLECQEVGRNSYFSDQTGVIRLTNENRPATVNDPPLGG